MSAESNVDYHAAIRRCDREIAACEAYNGPDKFGALWGEMDWRAERKILRRERAAMLKPYYENGGVTIYHGDCLEVLDGLAVRLSAFVTDPPFAFAGGISNGMTSQASDQFFTFWWRSVCQKIIRLCGPAGCGFIWCDWKSIPAFSSGFTLDEHNYEAWRVAQMLFHYREMPGMGQPFRSSVDMIGYVRGPKHKNPPIPNTTQNFISSYWYYGKHDHHPAEKSPGIAKRLVQWAGAGPILDPFMGSGTTLLAAKSLGVGAIGIELEEHFCETAARRLEQEVLGLSTPESETSTDSTPHQNPGLFTENL